jgi:hypothetical protein
VRVYLDVCCLNRPFDDQSQERIRLEAESVVLILMRIQAGALEWVSSEVVDYEIGVNPDSTRRSRVAAVAAGAARSRQLEDADERRGQELEALGFKAFDALHLACAEAVGADVFLTTDDKLLAKASRQAAVLRVVVRNPLHWLLEESGQWT